MQLVKLVGFPSLIWKQAPAKAVCSQMWVFKETDKYITLFGTYSYDEKGKLEFGEVITIPKIWI